MLEAGFWPTPLAYARTLGCRGATVAKAAVPKSPMKITAAGWLWIATVMRPSTAASVESV